jgi:hypothetical protein
MPRVIIERNAIPSLKFFPNDEAVGELAKPLVKIPLNPHL